MTPSFASMIRKLQHACNSKFDAHLVYNKTEFYSAQQDKPISIWIIKKAIWNDDKGKFSYEELFSSASQVQIVKFLRDYWYDLNGWEVPTDDEQWNKAKENYFSKKKSWHDVEYAVHK